MRARKLRKSRNLTLCAAQSADRHEFGALKRNVDPICSDLPKVDPKVPDVVLRKFTEWFPKPGSEFPLDPSYEPDRKNIPVHLRHLPRNPEHEAVFKQLQACNRHGLVVPVGADAMYYAAIKSKSCKLTVLGEHYRQLVSLGRI